MKKGSTGFPPPKKASLAKDEGGIALLMSLGVLSLLIILALSFAVRTMNSMKGVQLSQDLVKVRLFDESGFQKVYQLLSGNFANPNLPENLFPSTKSDQDEYIGPKPNATRFNSTSFDGSVWGNRAYWYSVGADKNGNPDTVGIDDALYLTIAGKDYTPSTDFTTHLTTAAPRFSWIHKLDKAENYLNNDTPIIARIAFLIVDESGKIDPATVLQTTAEGTEAKIGKDINEINLENVIGAALSGKLKAALPDPKWTSHYNIYQTIQKTSTTDPKLSNTDVTAVQQHLFPHSYDIEAFAESVDDGSMQNKHRFNLGSRTGATDWWDNLADPKIDAILQAASDFGATNNGGIPWLSIPYNDTGTDTDLKDQIAQTAANIVDYCDDDNPAGAGTDISIATSDYDGTNIPTYCGNEKVPYISEIEFSLELESPGAGGNLTLDARAELINVFAGEALNASGRLTLTVEVAGVDDGVAFTNTLPYIWDPTNIFNTTPTASSDYYHNLDWDGSLDVPGYNDDGTLNNITITVVSAVLEDDSGPRNLWDFSTTDVSSTLNPVNEGIHTVSVEVDDPRNNLKSSEWVWRDWDTGGDSIGFVNSNFRLHDNSLTEKDQEDSGTVTEPWEISTNFIRNEPMKSLWEVGVIHRGAPWQTINLKAYRKLFIQQVDEQGLDDYSSGDANILSQVKLSEDEEVVGRVNINTYNSTVLAALFNGILSGTDYDNAGSTTAIDAAQATNLANAVLTENGTSGGETFRFRGQIGSVSALSDTSIITTLPDTDRAKEEIIGKMANLTTVRQNYFTAIITSQIIKDVVSGYKNGLRGVFDPGTDEDSNGTIDEDEQVDKILAQQRLIALLYRDAITNEFRLIRYEYLDE